MVKRQKEKQYQSAREHREISQLRSGSFGGGTARERRLPFHCCALTLTPFHNPMCNAQGIVFENTAIVPFLLKNKVDPVTGTKAKSTDMITLHMDKDDDGKWQCPVLTKAFNDHTKIVAIKNKVGNEANVYSWQAYKELNLKTKNMYDLISNEKFTKKDVIILNDPEDEEFNKLRDINNFYHITDARLSEASNRNATVQKSITATRIMEKLSSSSKGEKRTNPSSSSSTEKNKKPKNTTRIITSDMVTGKKMTSGLTSGSFTSSSMAISNTSELREATQEEILVAQFAVMKRLKKKGYVTLRTNMGNIGIELHCDIAPRACTNFLCLAEDGKYDNTKFHRLIPSFMIQGGKGENDDDSFWGGPFVDEFDDRLKHDTEGIVSMANSGPKTNRRQFFITFKEASHLNRKHTIFGKIVGKDSLNVLREMKKVSTDKKDRPIHNVIINTIEIFVNPAKEAEELEKVRIDKLIQQKIVDEQKKQRQSSGLGEINNNKVIAAKTISKKSTTTSSIGKYLPKSVKVKNKNNGKKNNNEEEEETTDTSWRASRLPPPPKKTVFGGFDGW